MDVDAYRLGLDPQTRAMIDRLREIVVDADPSLVERIKWNAPSFAVVDDDRITLGVERKGGVRMVLHRGAAALSADGFYFDDPDSLAAWPTPDRGVMKFEGLGSIDSVSANLVDLCRRWIKRTT